MVAMAVAGAKMGACAFFVTPVAIQPTFMYGYLDESGAPGATTSTNVNEFLVLSLVLFADKATADKCSVAMDRLRARIGKSPTYEFHCSRNSSKAQEGLLMLLPALDFSFITISVRKTRVKSRASYLTIARLLVRELREQTREIKIEMDSNPVLFSRIKQELCAEKLMSVRVRQVKSHSNNLIQLADYVANLSLKRVKNPVKAVKWFRPLAKKRQVFVDIRD